MRLAWYCPYPFPNLDQVAQYLISRGHDFTALSLRSYMGEMYAESADGRIVRSLPDPVPRGRSKRHAYWHRAKCAVLRERHRSQFATGEFEILHSQQFIYQVDGIRMPKLRKRLPVVSTVHDVLPHETRMPSGLQAALHRWCYGRAGHLICYHEVLKTQLVCDFGVPSDLVHVVPHPIERLGTSTQLGKAPSVPTFLLIGSLRTNKGIPELLQAFGLTRSQIEAHLVIAGTGSSRMAGLIREAASRDRRITFLEGFYSVEKKSELLQSASYVVLPYTHFNSQSGVLADAYRYRVPVIATRVGALGESVTYDGTGIVVAPGAVEELAQALIDASAIDPKSWSHSLSLAVEQHSPERVASSLEEIYQAVVAS